MRCIAVYGASGFGREVMPLVRLQHGDRDTAIVFVDDGVAGSEQVLSFDAFLARPEPQKQAVIAIANSAVREKLATRCAENGVEIIDVRASNACSLDNVEIGDGSILCGFTHLTSDVRIGRHFHANIYAYVAHDCVIGDYVTFAPGVKCNGNVHIDDHAYIGTGAILKQGMPDKPLKIGRGAVIGMGAVVTKDVAPGETVIGNPARPMQPR
ncbi:acetyltransferase [Sphingomonas sp. HF-S4]|uniref:Acetyltransferase n=1 Tax=Sphingomonas agrestis TaxID=3080540 RepID=A0ABU3YAN0_9SPHN|nr:acetyltransferase [Sphingomonas sp. HF-S4]MDV3458454.1 acetyltransferase [Sphingomonas sp. HF-S4]